MLGYFTTLTDETGLIHRVWLPVIPSDYPDGGSVVVRSDCRAGSGRSLPARLARQTTQVQFRERDVTCPFCLANAR